MRRNNCVQVNSGSGCLFKLCNDQYDYILTAKHLLKDTNTAKWKNPQSENYENLTIIDEPLFHENHDAAILKVTKVASLHEYVTTSLDGNDQDIVLAGFPKCRTAPDEFRTDYGRSHEPNANGVLELEIDGSPIFDEVNGMSGGPVTKKHDESVLLAIQCKMVTKDDTETLGRTSAVPIQFFEEIIAIHNKEENELEGLTLISLDILTNHTFKLRDLTFNKPLVTRCLKREVEEIANTLSINDINTVYGGNLSLGNSEISDKNYWVGLLEALSLKKIKSDFKIDRGKLEEIKATFRVVYCEVGGLWIEAIADIYGSNLIDLKKGSIVFVVTNKDKKPTKTEYPANLLMRINEVPPVEDMLIDNASIENPFVDINIRHIYSVEKLIIDKEDILADCNAMSIKKTIKGIANDFI
ncbi:ABC-three component system protein [Vibrio splendidus]|uniref:ABC-three component system protein n=1 Tax=Vibrio splendidus TaxID=29497 RepID=UPI0008090139|nr:ABC-three component system protein [Vibrio splendidus]SBS62806.1 hypothetical protein VHE8714_01426 [Vibrio splendidus]